MLRCAALRCLASVGLTDIVPGSYNNTHAYGYVDLNFARLHCYNLGAIFFVVCVFDFSFSHRFSF